MLLPYHSVMNLMYAAVPIYEWERVPSADAQAAAAADVAAAADGASDRAGEGGNEPTTSLQLVFKGVRWVPVQTWGLRENPAWNQISQDQRDEDARRSQERARQAQREHMTPAQAAAAQCADGSVDVAPGAEGGVD